MKTVFVFRASSPRERRSELLFQMAVVSMSSEKSLGEEVRQLQEVSGANGDKAEATHRSR